MDTIGFYDSGVGGISVLREALKMLPNEHYVFYGDTKNAPYGTKTQEQIQQFAFEAVELLISKNAKAIVIACNTATSAAAAILRSRYTLPIIGMEPALKPAHELRREGQILVMATPLTLHLPKFKTLMGQYGDNAVPVPCKGLMEFVEKGITHGQEVEEFILSLIGPYLNKPVDAVVLGCTHYVFLKKLIQSLLPAGTHVVDGNLGTVKQLERRLREINALAPKEQKGSVELFISGDETKTRPIIAELLCDF